MGSAFSSIDWDGLRKKITESVVEYLRWAKKALMDNIINPVVKFFIDQIKALKQIAMKPLNQAVVGVQQIVHEGTKILLEATMECAGIKYSIKGSIEQV
mmetsp:Transcript_24898/g.45566  ORF Transcript_24898/g.45566 Transcript_24898/m.45566 type:complete len:99 (-) Transcript_24898:19-315(-)